MEGENFSKLDTNLLEKDSEKQVNPLSYVGTTVLVLRSLYWISLFGYICLSLAAGATAYAVPKTNDFDGQTCSEETT